MDKIKSKKPSILLIEDDPADQLLVKRALEESKISHDLYIVEDGEEALDFLLKRNKYEKNNVLLPELILLDINLPIIDGKEVLREIRKNALLKHIIVIALSTSCHEEEILQTYQIGVNSYIKKPDTLEGYINIIKGINLYWFEISHLPLRER